MGLIGLPAADRCGAERDCYLRDFNFLGFVVLITAVETVDNWIWPHGSGVKPCSRIVR